jgi:hypothetical protein
MSLSKQAEDIWHDISNSYNIIACSECPGKHCCHSNCSTTAMFTDHYRFECRINMHYEVMKKQSALGFGDKFAPTGLTYFTTPITYQYIHLNSGIKFRSPHEHPRKAGSK